ncbi:MAG: bifunctional pyr operon transcriptional regulator/uracil phosphoribosyltransferase PyrR [Deltaproteobacteria bacterium]|nr:bifunctional pyr operon transcriptional regulator/uracil phosphoribosyltransferase PyrR [Deltaproteobacteria bacterium]
MTGNIICESSEMGRILERIAAAVLRRNQGRQKLALVGILTRGVCLAQRLQRIIREQSGLELPLGSLDITLYRDDLAQATHHPVLRKTEIPFSLDGATVVLIDDVLYTGRTVRAAMDGLIDFGRPQSIQLAVLVDRGCRELPIAADYIGVEVPASTRDRVMVRVAECDGFDSVTVMPRSASPVSSSGGE